MTIKTLPWPIGITFICSIGSFQRTVHPGPCDGGTRKHCSRPIASYHCNVGLWAIMRMTTLSLIEKGRLGKDDEQPLCEFKTGVFGSEFTNSPGGEDSHRGEFTSPLPRALECFVEGFHRDCVRDETSLIILHDFRIATCSRHHIGPAKHHCLHHCQRKTLVAGSKDPEVVSVPYRKNVVDLTGERNAFEAQISREIMQHLLMRPFSK